ncbi:MAG: hypothetical protein IIA00_09195 [Proteobacteria bacterium]|nr:hypothetical protein [Pseudomonadota bacterium]
MEFMLSLATNRLEGDKMHKSGKMYLAILSYMAHHKAGLTRTAAGGLVSLMMASPSDATELKPDFYPQLGAPHTMTYKDSSGKDIVVYDLRGKWEGAYPEEKEVVIISQKENSFKGVKTVGSFWVPKGSTTIKGKLLKGNVMVCSI